MTDRERHSLADIAGVCGFRDRTTSPNDAACPVTPYLPEFVPSRLIDEARSGWFPKGIRYCIGCDLCSPGPEASFADCADLMLLEQGPREGNIPRAFGGALDAVVALQIRRETSQARLGWVKEGIEIAREHEKGDVALFVGCAPYYDALLGDDIGCHPSDEARAAVELLNSVGVRPVVLSQEVCCGGDHLHAGDSESFLALGNRNLELLRARRVKTVVTACDDCFRTLSRRYPGRIPGWDFTVLRVPDFLVMRGGKLAFMPTKETVAVQPPDRYSDPDGRDSVRKVLARVPELTVKEIEAGHPSTFGSWGQFDSITKRIETDFLSDAEATGASAVLVPGIRALVRLLEGRRPGSWEETSIQIKGLLSFLAERHTVAEEFAGA